DLYVTNHLINMYCKCGYLDYAHRLIDEMPERNLVSWTALVSGYAQHGLSHECFRVFSAMLEHYQPNEFAVASVLSSCDYLHGKLVHALALKMSLDCFAYVVNALINMYCRSCGYGDGSDEAWRVFVTFGYRNRTSWNSMIAGFLSHLGGDVADCHRLFMENNCRDIVMWTGIITAFAERDPEEALFFFRQLRREDFSPDRYTFSIALKACAGLVTERHALAVHSQVTKAGFDDDPVVANALVHAYARSGAIASSKQVFDEMRIRNLVSWNSMLKAYALHGQAEGALQLFSQMNVKPDSATIVALLSACSHAGLVEEGTKIFESMFEKYGIVPELDHYACMIDILGRAGYIGEAEKLISRMPMEPDAVVWSALLGSCRKHGETQLADLAAHKLQELQPGNSLGYVQLSNMYCCGGSFNEAGLIWKGMKGSRVRKEPGLSWIELGNKVHEFASGGQRHPQREAICAKLEALIGRLKEIGYVPETSLALRDIEVEQKEEQLYHHSEKLALAFAITSQGSLHCGRGVITIMKNIRICVDCHNFMKLASDLLSKEIVVRDSNRFHRFKNKFCSCNDYW
ncbi:PPR domain-containing protein/PPR_2 domain-containing protein/DYW_deaminase domain-containing protein, partial [Cephalotus follicularis]